MKPYGNYKEQSKSKNHLKGKWSRLELANFERTFNKKTRQDAKKEITIEITNIYD